MKFNDTDAKNDFFNNSIAIHELAIKNFLCHCVENEDSIDDIVQAAMEKAWINLEQLRKAESAKSWVFKIAINEHYKYLRAQSHGKYSVVKSTIAGEVEDNISDTVESALDGIIREIEIEYARKALEMLSEEERLLISMRYIYEFPCKQMAQFFMMKEKTLSSKLCRAVKKYRQVYFSMEKGR